MENRRLKLSFLSFLLLAGCASEQVSERKNCKLSIRTTMKDGSAKVSVEEKSASSRDHCKLMAKRSEENNNPEEVASIKSTYSYRETGD